MKKIYLTLIVLLLFGFMTFPTQAAHAEDLSCATIASGTIHTGNVFPGDGSIIKKGYDAYGYNYERQEFSTKHCNGNDSTANCTDWDGVNSTMTWNDGYLSTTDCDHDGFLDAHFGFETYQGSGAWFVQDQAMPQRNVNGKRCVLQLHTKIAAVPFGATLTNGIWYDASNSIIGPDFFPGQFLAIIEDSSNDACN